MTKHPFDFKNTCCLFDADAPIHDMTPVLMVKRCPAVHEGLQCDHLDGHKDDNGQVVHRHDKTDSTFVLWVDP